MEDVLVGGLRASSRVRDIATDEGEDVILVDMAGYDVIRDWIDYPPDPKWYVVLPESVRRMLREKAHPNHGLVLRFRRVGGREGGE